MTGAEAAARNSVAQPVVRVAAVMAAMAVLAVAPWSRPVTEP